VPKEKQAAAAAKPAPHAKAASPAGGPQPGDLAPAFRLPTDEGREIALSDLRGKKVVLYFYPKDATPG